MKNDIFSAIMNYFERLQFWVGHTKTNSARVLENGIEAGRSFTSRFGAGKALHGRYKNSTILIIGLDGSLESGMLLAKCELVPARGDASSRTVSFMERASWLGGGGLSSRWLELQFLVAAVS